MGHFFMLFAIRHFEVCWDEISYIFEKKTSPLILIIKYIFDTIIVSDIVLIHWSKRHIAALLTLKTNWLDTLTMKHWKVMINNDVFFFSCNQWGNTFFWIKMTNGFSGKSKLNKFLLLILSVFLSIPFKLKSEINKNVINRNINLWKKQQQQLNFESEYKGHKIGENPNLGLPRVHEIVWNIWKLKKNSVCVWICRLSYLLISINGHSYFSVALFILLCCTYSNKDFQYCIIFFCSICNIRQLSCFYNRNRL